MIINIFSYWKFLLVIGIALTVSYFSANLARYSWKVWVGNDIHWRGINIKLDDDFFVIPATSSILNPISDDQPIMIGKFDSSEKAFPGDSYMFVDNSKYDATHLLEIFKAFCKEKDCTEFEEYESVLNNAQTICVQFRRVTSSLYKGEFHAYCNARPNKIVVEYHGSFDDFRRFKILQNKILAAIAKATTNPTP